MSSIEKMIPMIKNMSEDDIQQLLCHTDKTYLDMIVNKMENINKHKSIDNLKLVWKKNIDNIISITIHTIKHHYPNLINNQYSMTPFIVNYNKCSIRWFKDFVIFRHVFKHTIKNQLKLYLDNGGKVYDKYIRELNVLKYNPINIKTYSGNIPYENVFFDKVLHTTTEQRYCENTECCVCYESCHIEQNCGHNTCLNCVEQITANGVFKCPLCRVTEKIGLNLTYDPHYLN